MGGPGAGRATRHELNIVPNHVGHGERVLLIGESPVPACRCCPPNPATIPPPILIRANEFQPSIISPTSISSPILTVLQIENDINADVINGSAKTAMSSPPKHRRGFDPNDATANDFRRYRRVKTKQR